MSFLALMVVAALPLHGALSEPDGLDALGFLVGSWRSEGESRTMEEHWIPASGGTMLAVNRSVASGKTVAFEFVRIEARDDGSIVYVAQPNGRAGTEFVLTSSSPAEAVFENPAHDFPKLIRYQKKADGSLLVTIEGDGESREFPFQPAP